MSTPARASRSHLAALLTLALASTCLAAQAAATTATAASVATVGATVGAGSAAPSPTTVRFTNGRTYVVSTRVGGTVLRGRGRLPSGLTRTQVRARPAADVLGTRSVEILLDYGPASEDLSVRVYSLHAAHRGKLRPVTLNGRQVVLASYTEGGDDGGFRCKRGRLLTHWYHHDSQQGEQIAYRLVGTRLRQVSHKPLGRAIASRPESCA